MASGMTLVSGQEYLSTNYQPACDYIDGVLRQKPMPAWKHGAIQANVTALIIRGLRRFAAGSEVTVKLRTGKYYVPDVIVQRRDSIQEPYPIEPVHLCGGIRSPEGRIGDLLAECEDYLEWGGETTWIIDPGSRRAWENRQGQPLIEVPPNGALTAGEISIPPADVFSVL
jgi:Uma2 family endonuclease